MAQQILIADDDAEVRDMLVALLERCGYEVIAVEDGEQACAWLDEHPDDDERPDLVLTDLAMPGRDGVTLLRWLSMEGPGIPVLVLTGTRDSELRNQAAETGALAVLDKPIDGDQLGAAVRAALEGQRPAVAGAFG